jgi:hypothetical protein
VFRGKNNKKRDFQDVLILFLVATNTRNYLFSVIVTVVLTAFSLASWSGLVGQL